MRNLENVNILLADDDIDDCIFFKRALRELDSSTQLVTVHDGEQLMQLLNSTAELPQILFLDLNMPRKNGIECLLEIKENDKLKELPVIVFSTSLEQDVVNRIYEYGAQYFIRKPPDFVEYKRIIKQALTLVATGGSAQPDRAHFVLTVQTVDLI